ncbi:hypothetical protein WOLCODRAFT_27351 [Wolfiporia cocos MD-104 SS10]|uniref:Uncharacterized protein n=1 Tax=Wolfiporia cocos (strain MD-104) TaxID=742152 RepID=A0A2H3JF68_WOLCO|nr:hypothetical protein WOLCODRAFT_27351 [Wolfiporia cocos MD-104 SS10]
MSRIARVWRIEACCCVQNSPVGGRGEHPLAAPAYLEPLTAAARGGRREAGETHRLFGTSYKVWDDARFCRGGRCRQT